MNAMNFASIQTVAYTLPLAKTAMRDNAGKSTPPLPVGKDSQLTIMTFTSST
jgi:hypothetical protein